MGKIIKNLFFVSLILLFNTCESPQEPDIEPPIIDSITITSSNITNLIDSVKTINEIITIKVNAIDNDKISEIWFAINDTIGNNRKVTSSPWEWNLNTSGYSDSSLITLRVVAKDASDNKTISDLYELTIDNTGSYPNNIAIISVEYDFESMIINWEESTDDDFKNYKLFHAEEINNFLNANPICDCLDENFEMDCDNCFYNQSETTYEIESFDPTINNWFWIQAIDQANLTTTSLSKSNEISQEPSQINNITVFYVNENTDILNIAWFPANDWDFKSYKLEHRYDWEGDDEWDLIWSSESRLDSTYCSPCGQNTEEFTPSTENEINNWFQITVTNHWGQESYPTEFNDADLDGPPTASQIISVEYDLNAMTVIWEETQEDLIEFKAYNLYHSTDSLINMAELIYSTTDECRDFNISNECTGLCIWDNINNICHNNSIMESSWSHQYSSDDTLYFPTHENWFWVEIEDQRGAKTIGQGKSNNVEQAPSIINITSLNSNIVDTETTINVTWERSYDDDFSYYTLYSSDYNWASADPIYTFNDINTTSFNGIIDIDLTVDNWFWITVTDIWNLESNVGSGMMILQDPMPQAVDVTNIEYNNTIMTIEWNESMDSTFTSYQVYKSNQLNGEYSYIDNSSIINQQQTSFIIPYPGFDPTIENWFKIKTIDNLGQFSFGSAKSNEIDPLPSTPILNTINYENDNNNGQQFIISWEPNTDVDFQSYDLYESYYSDMSNSAKYNFENQNETSFTRIISDQELGMVEGLLFYQLAVNDFWDQSSYSNISVGSNHTKFVNDYGNSSYDFIFSVISDEDGYTTSGIYDNEIWNLQIDTNGNTRHNTSYPFNSYQGIGESDKSMIPTSDNGYLITGYTRHLGNDEDAFLMKLNETLDSTWTKFFCQNSNTAPEFDNICFGSDTRNERGVSILETSNGDFVFTGSIESLGDGSNGYFVWALKINSDGVVQWNSGTSLPNSTLYDNTGINIIEAVDQNYIIFGNVDNIGSSTDIWVNKLNSEDGTKIWEDKYFGGLSIDEAYSTIKTSDGNYLIAGATRSFGNGGYDGWVIKMGFDANGNEIEYWNKTFGGSNDDKIHSVIENSDGTKLTFCGYSRSYNDQNDDIWIFQTDNEGNEIFNKTISGNLADKGYGIKEAPDGGFIISGISQSINDSGDLQAVLIKTDPQGNTIAIE